MTPSTALSRNRNRGRPELTAEEWEEEERALEESNRYLQQMYDATIAGEAPPANADPNARQVTKKVFEEPAQHISSLARSLLAAESFLSVTNLDKRASHKWALGMLYCMARIVGPETSMEVLYFNFGRGALKRALSKLRGHTSVHSQDYSRIRIYIDLIMWATGDSMRRACQRLAKMGLKVRKDFAQGRAWVLLDNPETIRKRYMDPVTRRSFDQDRLWWKFYERDLLKLKVMWHRSGEPPFANWLKQQISREAAGGNPTGFFWTS
jgi:hypothetical protein